MKLEQVYTPLCAVLRGSNVSVRVVFSPAITGGETMREVVELSVLLSEYSHVRWKGVLVTAIHVRVSFVPAVTGFSCETEILSMYSRSEEREKESERSKKERVCVCACV